MLRRSQIVGGGCTSGIVAGGVDGLLHRGIPTCTGPPLRTWKDRHEGDERSSASPIPRQARPRTSRSPPLGRSDARPSSAATAVVAPASSSAEFDRTTSTTKALHPRPRPPADADAPPLMLLTGDEFHVGSDGICRTLYRLLDDSFDDGGDDDGDNGSYVVEESFHLERAHKTFVLRGPPSRSERSSHGRGGAKNGAASAGPLPLGPRLFELDLREIDGGAGGPAGTGAATWESSIAMALHFARHPDLLGGGSDGGGGQPRDVIELGSGVGAGGILTKVATDIASASAAGRGRGDHSGEMHAASSGNSSPSPPRGGGPIRSITLTDASPEVLARAGENVRRAGIGHCGNVEVRALDWNDFDRGDYIAGGVDVIASDCVYSREHVVPLADAITTLLGSPQPDDGEGISGSGVSGSGSGTGTAHLFGPCNRSPLGEMVMELGDARRGLDVRVDTIELERCRLRPPPTTHRPDPSTTPVSTAAAGRGGGGGGDQRRDDDDDLAPATGSLGVPGDGGGHVIASRNVAKLVYIRASSSRGGRRCTTEEEGGGSLAADGGPRTTNVEGGLCGID